jgi:hypothetical protein
LLLLLSHPSLSESFHPLDGRLNWISASRLVSVLEREGAYRSNSLEFVLTTCQYPYSHLQCSHLSRPPELTDCNYTPSAGFCPDVTQPLEGLEMQLPVGSQ